MSNRKMAPTLKFALQYVNGAWRISDWLTKVSFVAPNGANSKDIVSHLIGHSFCASFSFTRAIVRLGVLHSENKNTVKKCFPFLRGNYLPFALSFVSLHSSAYHLGILRSSNCRSQSWWIKKKRKKEIAHTKTYNHHTRERWLSSGSSRQHPPGKNNFWVQVSYLLPSILYPMSWLLTSSCMNMDKTHSAPHFFSLSSFVVNSFIIHLYITCTHVWISVIICYDWHGKNEPNMGARDSVCMHSSSFICLQRTHIHHTCIHRHPIQ